MTEALKAKLFHSLGVDGVYGRTGSYEAVVGGLTRCLDALRPEAAEVFRFPPVMSRAQIERSGYLKTFPNLLGCMCALDQPEAQSRVAAGSGAETADWTSLLSAGDLVLTPAACYPLYPILAARGRLSEGGVTCDVACECFRREPSTALDRFQYFRMREFVRIGAAHDIVQFRQDWIAQARALADDLGLQHKIDLASDPFFGRAGVLMANSQIEQALKFELLVPVISAERPTACMSFNYHQDHFGETWDLKTHDGALAHTGCVAFGMDRLAVALFATHGPDSTAWPQTLKARLDL